jgi:hypothetical protein
VAASEALESCVLYADLVGSLLSEDMDQTAAAAAVPTDPAQREEWTHFQKVNPPTTCRTALPGFYNDMVSVLIPSSPPRFLPPAPYPECVSSFRRLLEQLNHVSSIVNCLSPWSLPVEIAGSDVKFPRRTESGTFDDGRPGPNVNLMQLLLFQQLLSLKAPGIIARSRLWVRLFSHVNSKLTPSR